MSYYSCMDDCIHLKACRRYAKIIKREMHGACVPRDCNEDCTAYVSGNQGEYISVVDACSIARSRYDGDSDSHDLYCSIDFSGVTLGEIIEEAHNDG